MPPDDFSAPAAVSEFVGGVVVLEAMNEDDSPEEDGAGVGTTWFVVAVSVTMSLIP